jgi:hypothetical protein
MKRKDRPKLLLQPEAVTNQSHTDPHNTSEHEQKCNVSGSIHVRGEIETHIPDEATKKRDAANEQKEARDKFRLRIEIAGLIFVIIYAGLTGFLVSYTSDQLKEARKVTKLSDENFRRSERAWINTNFVTPVFYIREGEPPLYKFAVHNYGQSPALNTAIMTHSTGGWRVNWTDIQQEMNNATPDRRSLITVAGGQDIPVAGPGVNATGFHLLTKEEAAGIENGTIREIVFGKIEYSDIFGASHTTTFCVFYSPYHADPLPNGGWGGCPVKTTAN